MTAAQRNARLEMHAGFSKLKTDDRQKMVWIVGSGAGKSIANDLESVAAKVRADHPGYRVFFANQGGGWAEMVFDDDAKVVDEKKVEGTGRFLHCRPADQFAIPLPKKTAA